MKQDCDIKWRASGIFGILELMWRETHKYQVEVYNDNLGRDW